MEQIWLVVGAVAVYFGAMAVRGLFGYLKNNKVTDVKFDWKKFVAGALNPVAITAGFGALTGLVLLFLRLVGDSGVEVAGIDQISTQTLLIGLLIADVGAIGYAMREALLVISLSDKQIDQIRDTASKTGDDEKLGVQISVVDGEVVATAINVKQDAGDGAETSEETMLAQRGAWPYYKVDVSSAEKFYRAVNGKGFNEGYGMQCVAAFKEHQYSMAGRIVATNTGGASGYANQEKQIEALGYTKYTDRKLRDGDWVIFGGGLYGHVAMYYKGKYFSQNQNAANPNVGNPFNLSSVGLPYLCHYRPNNLKPKPAPKPTPKPPATSTYKIVKTINGYMNSADAKAKKRATNKVKAGNYYVFNKANGMVNVTKKKGVPGSWINPAENKASKPAPAKKYVTVKAGWGLSNVAQAAGFKDFGNESRWKAIAKLNGSSNWKTYNKKLTAGKKVRVK